MSNPSRPIPPKGSSLVELEQLSVSYGSKEILSHINLKIGAGELVAIVGPNGVGKSTLVKALLGLIPSQSQKRILLGRKDPDLLSLAGGVAYIPQRFELNRLVPLSVDEFLRLKRRNQGLNSQKVSEWLARFELPPEIARASIHEISGGQLQRVLLAFALAGDPQLICLDEGAEGIDPKAQETAFRLLSQEVDAGKSVIFVSHDISAVSRFAKRVICLGDGVGYDGAPGDPSFHSCLHEMYGEGSFIHDHAHSHTHRGDS